MANNIPMTTREAIKALQQRGYSKRKIAWELGIHRNTVAHYLGEAAPETEPAEEPSGAEPAKADESQQGESKCTISTPGSGQDRAPESGPSPSPSESGGEGNEEGGSGRRGGRGDQGRQSHCAAYREIIEF
jgi:hypothetical protein